MDTILIIIHLLVVIALVGLILMQRSEGGGLGIGGGGGGFMSARGATNVLTRTTAILAALFFATSLGLSLLARYQAQPTDIFDRLPQDVQPQDGGGTGILDQLGGAETVPSTGPSGSAPSQQEPVSGDSVPSNEDSVPSPAEEAIPAAPEGQVPTGQ